MTIPKHNDPADPNRVATAPYNFVPLPDDVALMDMLHLPGHGSYQANRCTGTITCRLTTESPLYVRNGQTPKEFENKESSPEFFTDPATGRPVIPGSSLRGMLRALVEIAGYSKIQPVTDEPLIYRVVGDTTSFGDRYRERVLREDQSKHYTPLIKAGYMKKQGFDWAIQPAQTIDGTTFARIFIKEIPKNLAMLPGTKNARKIWIKPGPYGYKKVRGGFIKVKFSDVKESNNSPTGGFTEASLVFSGPMQSKLFEKVIFPPDEAAEPISVPDAMVRTYREQISKEQEKLLGKAGVLQEGQPVFYLLEQDRLVFFGHTMMLRLPYLQSPQDFIPTHLKSKEKVDIAEAIFGYTDLDLEQSARAGRVSVTDAVLAQGQTDVYLTEDAITPKILSGPKPTSFQHYLTQPTPDSQVVGRTKDGKPKTKEFLSHYASPQSETVIRGHKLYWHKPVDWADDKTAREFIEDTEFLGQPQQKQAEDTQHTKIRPIRPGTQFEFRLHFTNLSYEELGALLWVLHLGAGQSYRTALGVGSAVGIEPKQEYRLKLGMGKPLGLGSIKTEARLTLTDRQQRYRALLAGDGWELGEQPEEQVRSVHTEALATFHQFILSRDPDAFKAEGRLTQLKALLNWAGPDETHTQYMELGAFRRRKVLPTPVEVLRSAPSEKTFAPPPEPEAEKPPVYAVGFTFEATIGGEWEIGGSPLTMPNGDPAVLKASRKKVKKLMGRTVTVVVKEIKRGVYYLTQVTTH
ncbi:MAG: TIGR03986 family CRISPR-associated RAMP protein [Anaerolineae bacterium]|nr:TIGR03986 family CRISPR-associated RAMP protein [Anaerolineae bacterium]